MTQQEEIKYLKIAWGKIQKWVKENAALSEVWAEEYSRGVYQWRRFEVYPNGDCAVRKGSCGQEREGDLLHGDEIFDFGYSDMSFYPENIPYDDWWTKDVFAKYRKPKPVSERCRYSPMAYSDNWDNGCYTSGTGITGLDLIRSIVRNWKPIKALLERSIKKSELLANFEV